MQRISHAHQYCFSEQELAESSEKVVQHFVGHRMDWKYYSSVQLVTEMENIEKRRKRRKRTPNSSCPNYETISQGNDTNERSISPWRYRIDVNENRYPQKLAFAQCLCDHCISTSTGRETQSLNSVLLEQNIPVLYKEPCPRADGNKKFTFRMDYLAVPVACTCALPMYV
uniref:Interleukin-17C n=2 Tax=Pyxicephalus adspersus TaxID=30357 RepID=A0AAV3A3S8_PYXAD|nr:TPA: hypothetical protein GDO54_002275 [Pyxicephalus adspersus]